MTVVAKAAQIHLFEAVHEKQGCLRHGGSCKYRHRAEGHTQRTQETKMKHGKVRACALILIILLTIFTGACATTTTKTSKGYMQTCLDFVGKDIESVIERWGYPDRTLEEAAEGRVYVYQQIKDPFGLDKIDYTPLIDYPPFIRYPEINGAVTGGYTRGQNCLTYFETDPENTIIKVTWKGDCTAEERK